MSFFLHPARQQVIAIPANKDIKIAYQDNTVTIGFSVNDAFATVSYTHLDVYKRQIFWSWLTVIPIPLLFTTAIRLSLIHI